MAILNEQLTSLEREKFYRNDTNEVVVRTSATGSFRITGLIVGGRISAVELNSSTWTALPTTPLTGRNAMAIQNDSGQSVYVNYIDTAPTTLGMLITDGSERQYDISSSILIYGICSSGTCLVTVEELA